VSERPNEQLLLENRQLRQEVVQLKQQTPVKLNLSEPTFGDLSYWKRLAEDRGREIIQLKKEIETLKKELATVELN